LLPGSDRCRGLTAGKRGSRIARDLKLRIIRSLSSHLLNGEIDEQ
jgi:hypothetical protein